MWDIRYIDAPVLRWRDPDLNGTLNTCVYYTTDANMNVTALVWRASGTVAERYAYDPYGRPIVLDADWSADADGLSDVDNQVLYCGYRYDAETGLYHVRYRTYHPTLGRWMQRDPATYMDSMNLQSYLDRLLMARDPLGFGLLSKLKNAVRSAAALAAETSLDTFLFVTGGSHVSKYNPLDRGHLKKQNEAKSPCEKVKDWLDEHPDYKYGQCRQFTGGPSIGSGEGYEDRCEDIFTVDITRPNVQAGLDMMQKAVIGLGSRDGIEEAIQHDPGTAGLPPGNAADAAGEGVCAAGEAVLNAVDESIVGLDWVKVRGWKHKLDIPLSPDRCLSKGFILDDPKSTERDHIPFDEAKSVLARWCDIDIAERDPSAKGGN